MAHRSSSPERPAPARLRQRLYGLAFVDEFGPLYALFTLWFADNGITAAQISLVFLLWAVVAIVFEIPSGALADRVDRRHLVAAAFVMRAIGIAFWLVWPTFAGVLIGAGLWALHSALASGAWEALIHDELAAVDAAGSYPTVMGRISQFSSLGVVGGTIVATALLAAGLGIEGLGWITVAIHGMSLALVVTLPDVGWVVDNDADDETGSWWSTLCSGVRTAVATIEIGRLIVIGAVLEGLFIFDEYVPLVARLRGAGDAIVPVLVLAIFVGLMAGGELAARRTDLGGRALGWATVAAAVLIGVTLTVDWVWPLALIGVSYGALNAALILSDARLQERIGAATRATVTSVRSFGSGMLSGAAYAMIAGLSRGDDPTRGLLIGAAALVGGGVLIVRWLPGARPTTSPARTA